MESSITIGGNEPVIGTTVKLNYYTNGHCQSGIKKYSLSSERAITIYVRFFVIFIEF